MYEWIIELEDTKDDFSVCIRGNDTCKQSMKIRAASFASNHENHCIVITNIYISINIITAISHCNIQYIPKHILPISDSLNATKNARIDRRRKK